MEVTIRGTMHRKPLLELLDRYQHHYPNEQEVLDKIRRLVESRADCFERNCRPGHLTGSAWILAADRQRILLTHHRKLNRWLQLGGHADGQIHVEQVALREAQEESGLQQFQFVLQNESLLPLDVDVHTIPERRDLSGKLLEGAHEHHDIRFLLIAESDDPLQVSDESHALRWFTPPEVEALTREESLLRMLYKAQPWMA